MTLSWSLSAESPMAKEHEGPLRAVTESPSGAQRVKKVSSSNREYSAVGRLWLLALCCRVLGLVGVLVSGTFSWTIITLQGSSDVMGVDLGAADWGKGWRRVRQERRYIEKKTTGQTCFLTFLQK